MYDLLSRTVSQGLQAFLPIAFALTWFRRAGQTDGVAGLRWGMAAALPATLAAMYGFQRSDRQSLVEAVLAGATLLVAIWFARRVSAGLPTSKPDGRPRRHAGVRLAFALTATLVIVRQTMEIAVAFAAAFELRAADPLAALAIGAVVSLLASVVWIPVGRWLPDDALRRSTAVFALLFAGQAAMYLFHESAEAGLLPWSDVLHAVTEPYGPDGAYGRYISAALFLVPLGTALVMRLKARPAASLMVSRAALILAGGIVAVIEVMTVVAGHGGTRSAVRPAPSAGPEVAVISSAPHLLFRHTAVDPNYGRLSVAPLDTRGDRGRAAAALTCERVSYGAGRGICLVVERGLFTSYKAVFFDEALNATRTIKIEGSPSRTRVSPDGRLGAITVFAFGSAHTYKGSSFSTRTTIVDAVTGDELADLEQFTAWRDGKRFKAADFNFWGVTFARDSNVFYVTLRTGGSTYLVRGDLGTRNLIVLRDNVECPALSPDNRLIAFKKRIGPADAPWRFYVLDLATLTEHPIAAETRSIDDQLEWLDATHVLYAAPRETRPSSRDVWVAPVDGSGPARIFLPDAESPIVVR